MGGMSGMCVGLVALDIVEGAVGCIDVLSALEEWHGELGEWFVDRRKKVVILDAGLFDLPECLPFSSGLVAPAWL